VFKIPSYLGGPKFDSWSRDPPYIFQTFVIFIILSSKMLECNLN